MIFSKNYTVFQIHGSSHLNFPAQAKPPKLEEKFQNHWMEVNIESKEEPLSWTEHPLLDKSTLPAEHTGGCLFWKFWEFSHWSHLAEWKCSFERLWKTNGTKTFFFFNETRCSWRMQTINHCSNTFKCGFIPTEVQQQQGAFMTSGLTLVWDTDFRWQQC